MRILHHTVLFLALGVCFVRAETEWNSALQLPSLEAGGASTLCRMNPAGVGAVIRKKEGKCIISDFFDGSGAEVAGLEVGDTIIRVGGKDVSTLDSPQIATLLRGDPDTKVTLTILRGSEVPRHFVVTRRPIKLEKLAAQPPKDSFAAMRDEARKLGDTKEGKTYEEQIASQFSLSFQGALLSCTETQNVPYMVDIVYVIGIDGTVERAIPDPEQAVSICIAKKVIGTKFLPPPKDGWLVSFSIAIALNSFDFEMRKSALDNGLR